METFGSTMTRGGPVCWLQQVTAATVSSSRRCWAKLLRMSLNVGQINSHRSSPGACAGSSPPKMPVFRGMPTFNGFVFMGDGVGYTESAGIPDDPKNVKKLKGV